MAMSKQQEAEFRRLVETVGALREGLQAALERIAALETKRGPGRPKSE